MELVNLEGPIWTMVVHLAFAAMVAILFLQSSLDKIFNWKSEMDYVSGHFAKSPLKGSAPLLLPLLTTIELLAGMCAAAGFVQVLFARGVLLGLIGMCLGTTAIVMLFFGQRVSKDYAGAASLIPYFLMCAAGMWVFLAD